MGRPVAPVLLGPVPADLSDRVLHVPAGTLAAQAGHGAAVLPVPRAVSCPRCSALDTIFAETGARNSTLSLAARVWFVRKLLIFLFSKRTERNSKLSTL